MKSKILFYSQSIIIIILVILLFKCCEDKQDDCINSDFENSPNKISDTLANAMEELYKENQFIFINDNLGIEDNRRHWFPLKELKSYICYIEEKADSLNYNQEGLGIRVYNAAKYDTLGLNLPLTGNGINDSLIKSTIFMVGTHNIMLDQPDDLENENSPENVFFPYPNINIEDDKAFNMGDPGGGDFKLKGNN